MNDQPTPRTGIDRRTLAKGAAWAVPAAAIVVAAPQVAASPGRIWFEVTGLACKTPGASCAKETGITKGYIVRVNVYSSYAFPTHVTIGDAMVSLNTKPSTSWEVSMYSGDPALHGWAPDPQGTLPLKSDDITYSNDVKKDPIVKLAAATATTPAHAQLDFGIQGQPSSENVSLDGSAPFAWINTLDTTENGSGNLRLYAAATPPCNSCTIPGDGG